MKDTELKRMRDRDLYSIYKQGLRDGAFTTMHDAVNFSRMQEAKHFYVSSTTASLLVGRILKNISLINLHPLSRKRAWALYDRYREYLDENGRQQGGKERIMEIIVEMPAPEFYMSFRAARRAIETERRKSRKQFSL